MFDLQKLREKLTPMAEAAKHKTDAVAEKVAGKMTEWAGKEVTPGHVKKIAAVSLAVVVGLHVLQGLGGAGGGDFGGGVSGGSAGGYEGFDNSFEGQSAGFFADKGGLNIETHTVDIDGVQLD